MNGRDTWEKIYAEQEKRRVAPVGGLERLTVALGPAEVAKLAARKITPGSGSPAAIAVRKIARAIAQPGHVYDDFQRLCMADNIACPVTEHRFHVERKWRFDYAWPDWYLAVEKDGGIYHAMKDPTHAAAKAHASPENILRDMEKINAAVLLGWRVLRYTPQQLLSGAVADVRRILQA